MNDVVIAEAWNYRAVYYSTFAGSLRANGYRGDIVVIGQPSIRQSILETMILWNITFSEKNISNRFYSQRFKDYESICVFPRTRCLCADFRDVFFQSNPFSHISEEIPDITVFEESWPVGKCDLSKESVYRSCINRIPYKTCLDEKYLIDISHYNVICSGVLLFTPKGIRELSQKLINISNKCKINKLSDQVSLNYIVRNNIINATIQTNGYNLVNTIGIQTSTIKASKYFLKNFVKNGKVLQNDKYTISPVVHQYDRLKLRVKLVHQSSPNTYLFKHLMEKMNLRIVINGDHKNIHKMTEHEFCLNNSRCTFLTSEKVPIHNSIIIRDNCRLNAYWNSQFRFKKGLETLKTEKSRWVLQLDDDSYLAMDNLYDFTHSKNWLRPDYFSDFANMDGAPCGGGGILFTGMAFQKLDIHNCIETCKSISNDIIIHKCASKYGLIPRYEFGCGTCGGSYNRSLSITKIKNGLCMFAQMQRSHNIINFFSNNPSLMYDSRVAVSHRLRIDINKILY